MNLNPDTLSPPSAFIKILIEREGAPPQEIHIPTPLSVSIDPVDEDEFFIVRDEVY